MKAKAKHLIFLIILLVITDVFAGFLFPYYLNAIHTGLIGKTNLSLKDKSECIVLGSSRAKHHYSTDVISKKTLFTCYNSGTGGYGLFYNYAVLAEVLNFHQPKIVILDISPNVIDDIKSYEKLKSLLPYSKKYKAFKEIVMLDPEYSVLNNISNFYVYNSTLYDFWVSARKKKTNLNGFQGLNGTISLNEFEPFYLQNDSIDENKIEYFRKIIELCKQNEIKLYCFVSPTFKKFDSENRIIDEFRAIASIQKIDFYDYSKDKGFYGDTSLFKDQLHLNNSGAELFSIIVASHISNDENKRIDY